MGGFHHLLPVADDVFGRRHVAVLERCRHLGCQHSGRLGFCDREFRLVGRNRSRGHIYLCDPAFALPAVAHCDQPVYGSDDPVCRMLRWFDALVSPGPAMGFLLAVSVSRHDAAVAAIPQPSRVGRLCSRYVFHDLLAVLVSRAGTRSGHGARSRKKALAKKSICLFRVGLA